MKYLLGFLLFLIPLISSAQKQGQTLIDSLLRELPTAKEDTNKVLILNKIAGMMWAYNPDDGIKYGQQSAALAEKLNWPSGMANAIMAVGVNYRYKTDYAKALENYQRALKINESISNKTGIASVYVNMCILFIDQSDYTQALDYGFKGLKINEELNNKTNTARTLTNIGLIYDDQGDYAKALEYHTKALKMYEQLNDKNSIAIGLSNIGLIYQEEKNYDQALEYQLRSMKICEEMGNNAVLSKVLCYLGIIYSKLHDYPKALENMEKSLKIDEDLGNKAGIAEKIENIGRTYLAVATDTTEAAKGKDIRGTKQENLKKAINYLSWAATIHRDIGDIKDLSQDYHDLSEALELSGDDKNALQAHKLYMINKDSVFSEQNKENIARLDTKRELDLKDKQIQIDKLDIAKKRSERIFFIAGILLLLSVILFVYRNYSLQKRSNILLSREKKRSEDLLLNILPSEVATELKEKGSSEAKSFDNVTVLFADFVNFTGMGEKMPPKELINELHTCFKAFDNIIDGYNIEKIKTVGDAYLVVSGLPVPDLLHAVHITHAAMQINNFMLERKAELGDKTFEVRIGIHSGSVVAGIVGVKKFAYDIWGDTVNVAARMEQNSLPGKINISQTTYDLVKNKFICNYRGEIEAKNKGLLGMYFVEGISA
jgi:adenylate cyclase